MQNYEKRIVAFIDILGFKELVKESEKDSAKLDLIYESLTFLKTMEKPESWDLNLIKIEESFKSKALDLKEKVSCTNFSDSILISVKVEEDKVSAAFSTLVANLSFIGLKLMINGILFRGGITYGKLIHNENGVVMGQGLIDAYNLENKIAKYPRIILSKKIIEKLQYPVTEQCEAYPFHQYIKRFDDGCAGFHQMMYLKIFQYSDNDFEQWELKKYLKKTKTTIIKGLDNNFESPRVYKNYEWLKKEYNNKLYISDKKEDIYEINENIREGNITYSYTDDYYHIKKKEISVKVDDVVMQHFNKNRDKFKVNAGVTGLIEFKKNFKQQIHHKSFTFSSYDIECVVKIIYSQIEQNKWTLGLDDEKKFSKNFIEFLLDTAPTSIFMKILKF